jgi:hypothetical protein
MELILNFTTKESTMEEQSKLPEEVIEDGFVEYTTTSEYIANSCNALNTIAEIDTALMMKDEEAMIHSIRYKCLKIIDLCVNEMYAELFEEEEE